MGYNKDLSGNQLLAVARSKLWIRDFADSDGTVDMSVDGSNTVNEQIWDGEGSHWTAPSIGSSETDAAYEGTNGWRSGVTLLGDEVRFTRSSTFDPEGVGDHIEGWIRYTALPATAKIQVRWEKAGVNAGDALQLEDYQPSRVTDKWLYWSIPLADFNLPGGANPADEFRFRTITVAGINYDLDLIQIVTGEANGIFEVAPLGVNQTWEMNSLSLVLSDGKTSWDSGKFGELSALANGLAIRHRDESTNSNHWRVEFKSISELMSKMRVVHDTSDTLTVDRVMSFELLPHPATVTVDILNPIQIVVKDDLSGLSGLFASAQLSVVRDDSE